MQAKTKRDYGRNNWCPLYVGETVYSDYLVGNWKVEEIGYSSSVRIRQNHHDSGRSILIEIDPFYLKSYPDAEFLSP